eukprot:TRINITY_DN2922_c0_g1_i1.p1 TRINITY_DN2922_c0_g1~~TRINITY_DN2922_c0_g1_i1.p1  ORF type:complete len:683 (+),score=116.59 TRINITY_DN2922_c0_g1_i1:51-2099(+)
MSALEVSDLESDGQKSYLARVRIIGETQVTNLQSTLVLVIDVSGSMNWPLSEENPQTYIQVVRRMLCDSLVEQLDSGRSIAVMEFSNRARILMSAHVYHREHCEELRQLVMSVGVKYQGGTNFCSVFDKIPDLGFRADDKVEVLFISDGQDNSFGISRVDMLRMAFPNLVLHTVGCGPAAGMHTLLAMSQAGGGRFFPVTSLQGDDGAVVVSPERISDMLLHFTHRCAENIKVEISVEGGVLREPKSSSVEIKTLALGQRVVLGILFDATASEGELRVKCGAVERVRRFDRSVEQMSDKVVCEQLYVDLNDQIAQYAVAKAVDVGIKESADRAGTIVEKAHDEIHFSPVSELPKTKMLLTALKTVSGIMRQHHGGLLTSEAATIIKTTELNIKSDWAPPKEPETMTFEQKRVKFEQRLAGPLHALGRMQAEHDAPPRRLSLPPPRRRSQTTAEAFVVSDAHHGSSPAARADDTEWFGLTPQSAEQPMWELQPARLRSVSSYPSAPHTVQQGPTFSSAALRHIDVVDKAPPDLQKAVAQPSFASVQLKKTAKAQDDSSEMSSPEADKVTAQPSFASVQLKKVHHDTPEVSATDTDKAASQPNFLTSVHLKKTAKAQDDSSEQPAADADNAAAQPNFLTSVHLKKTVVGPRAQAAPVENELEAAMRRRRNTISESEGLSKLDKQ